jgi:RNA polymerase sigma-70 factor (ECF subfamily)
MHPDSPPTPEAWPDDAAATADLIARARLGDAEAVEILFARHMPALRRWASGRLPDWARDVADTGDLVQATAMEAFRHLDRFEVRGEGALQAYLRTALMNRLRNEIRRSSRNPTPAVLDSGVPDQADSPLDAAIRRQQFDKYSAALDLLEPAERDAIIGRLEFGLSYRELAEVLEKPSADAARMAVTRALVALAAQMK